MLSNKDRIQILNDVETLSLIELKVLWEANALETSEMAKFVCEIVHARVAQLIAETDTEWSGEGNEPDYSSTAGEFLNS